MKFRAVISNEGILGVRYVVRTIWFTANERNTHTRLAVCVANSKIRESKSKQIVLFC